MYEEDDLDKIWNEAIGQPSHYSDGLYHNSDGHGLILVLTSHDDRYAIQLDDDHDTPQFGYQSFSSNKVELGRFLGKAYPGFANGTDHPQSRRCGLLVRKKLRLYFKATNPNGGGKLIKFSDIQFEEPSDFTVFYPQWFLYRYEGDAKHVVYYPDRTAVRCQRYTDLSWKWARDFGRDDVDDIDDDDEDWGDD